MRRVLRGAGERVAKAGGPKPLFTYNDFIFAFEHPSEGSRQWKLGRDLIAIRMLELLQKRNLDLSQLPNEDEAGEEAETAA
jgi:predicted RNA-binding protein (virulence factor B family)